jgi:hypothetical protein
MICRVWWFYTIVLGGAFAQVARSLAGQAKEARLKPAQRVHAATVLWEVFLLLLIVQVWVAVGYYRETLGSMTVLQLAAFLAVPVGIFLLATILNDNGAKSDDAPSDGDPESSDPQAAAFGRLRTLFFGVVIAMVAINMLHSWLRGDLVPGIDLAAQSAIVVGAVIGLFLRSRKADAVLAIVMIVVIAAYLGLAYGSVTVAD